MNTHVFKAFVSGTIPLCLICVAHQKNDVLKAVVSGVDRGFLHETSTFL